MYSMPLLEPLSISGEADRGLIIKREDRLDFYGCAFIHFAEGRRISFKACDHFGASERKRDWSVGLFDSQRIMLYLQIYLDKGLRVGEYDGCVTLAPFAKCEVISAKYDSYRFKSKMSGQPGSAVFSVEKVNKRDVGGRFNATLFSKSGEKITIEGGVFWIPRC